jgi:GAF domain-containing protein
VPLKRGVAARRLQLIGNLRGLLRSDVTGERMYRSVAALLAREMADYCIADVLSRRGVMERLVIEHADPSLRTQLQVAAEVTVLPPQGRVGRLLARGGTERIGRLTEATRTRALADVDLPRGPALRSYMAAVISVSGTPLGVLSLISTTKGRQFSEEELEFLGSIADWTGLGLENALRRELQPRATVGPPRLSMGPPRLSFGPPASQTTSGMVRKSTMARSG